MKKIILAIILCLSSSLYAADLYRRLGVGFSNQLDNGLPALSMKIQQSKVFALGALFGFRSNQDNTLYGGGLKLYRLLYDEPQLNFYMAALVAHQNYLDEQEKVRSGVQVDGTLGTEFHFTGLESIGFSFEFGLSSRNTNAKGGSSLETLGDHFLKSAVHFYL